MGSLGAHDSYAYLISVFLFDYTPTILIKIHGLWILKVIVNTTLMTYACSVQFQHEVRLTWNASLNRNIYIYIYTITKSNTCTIWSMLEYIGDKCLYLVTTALHCIELCHKDTQCTCGGWVSIPPSETPLWNLRHYMKEPPSFEAPEFPASGIICQR